MQSLGNMGSNACAGIDKDDRERLGQAAKALVDARGLIMMITDTVGHVMSGGVVSAAGFIQKKFGFDLTTKAEEIVEAVLWRTQSMAMIGMDAESDSQPWNWFHKPVAAASGASG